MQKQYAIIQINGKQYIVHDQESLEVDRLETDDATFVVSDVLAVHTGKELMVGQPLVAGAKVTFTVGEHSKGDKIRVAKYKAKSRYRRVHGHRQHLTTLTAATISVK